MKESHHFIQSCTGNLVQCGRVPDMHIFRQNRPDAVIHQNFSFADRIRRILRLEHRTHAVIGLGILGEMLEFGTLEQLRHLAGGIHGKAVELLSVFIQCADRDPVLFCGDREVTEIGLGGVAFRGRDVDYYSFHGEKTGAADNALQRADRKAYELTLELIAKDEYDLIVCCMTDYDHQMRYLGPFSPEAAAQAHLAAKRFKGLQEAMDRYWKKYNRTLVFVPDHGGHYTDETHGGHGSDLPEDMLVSHYYRISEKQR